MEILNDPPEERENDEVSLINFTLLEKLELCRRYKLENPKISRERIKVSRDNNITLRTYFPKDNETTFESTITPAKKGRPRKLSEKTQRRYL
jgi:hypothetical protein